MKLESGGASLVVETEPWWCVVELGDGAWNEHGGHGGVRKNEEESLT